MPRFPGVRSIEPRRPVILAILAVLALLTALPDRVRVLPVVFTYLVGFSLLGSIVAVPLSGGSERWLRGECRIIWLFFWFAGGGNLLSLLYLIGEMVERSGRTGELELLSSSIAVWVINVIVFSLLYWQIDRGGPEARIEAVKRRETDGDPGRIRPDWLFPQTGVPEEVAPDWHATFIDYLFLAFTTATAFSPTDALPLTPRAKALMMLESGISLLTIVVVASRAVSLLGS